MADKTVNLMGHELTLRVGNYVTHPMAMSIQLFEDGEPYATPTVNLGVNDIGNGSFIQCGSSFVNDNGYMKGIVDEMVSAGLGEPYMRFGEPVVGCSGFNEYPLFSFNMTKLEELDPEGVDAYRDTWAKGLAEAQKERLRSTLHNPSPSGYDGGPDF